MKLTILLIFLISINIQAQETVNEIFINSVALSPSLTSQLNNLNTDDSITEVTEAKDIVDYRKLRKHNEHTIHAPMKALTLSEFRQIQGQNVENADTSTEENDIIIIGTYESE